MPDMIVRLYALAESDAGVQEKLREIGYVVRRAAAHEKSAVVRWVSEHFSPRWGGEADVAFSRQPIACFIALHRDRLVGFACYEATCRGFFGPGGVLQPHRGHGLGTALLLECLRSMRAMGYAYAIIGGVGPSAFYAKTVGAVEIPDSTPGIYPPPIGGSS